jgi:hypothetical protein
VSIVQASASASTCPERTSMAGTTACGDAGTEYAGTEYAVLRTWCCKRGGRGSWPSGAWIGGERWN